MVSGCYLIRLVSVVGASGRVLADFPPWKSLSLVMIQRMPENLAGCYGGVHPVPDSMLQLCRFGVRRELSGKGEEMVGNLTIGLLFGNFAAAKPLKMAGDDGRGANGI